MTRLNSQRYDYDDVIPLDGPASTPRPESGRLDYTDIIPLEDVSPEELTAPPSTLREFLNAKGITEPVSPEQALASGVVGEFVKSRHDYIKQLPEGDPQRLAIAKALEPTEQDLHRFNQEMTLQRAAKARRDEPFLFGKTRGELELALTEPLGPLGGAGTVAGATMRGLATGAENLAGTLLNYTARGSSFVFPEDALVPLQVVQDREIMARIAASIDDKAGLDEILTERGANAYRGAMQSMPTVFAGAAVGGPIGALSFIGAQAFDDGLTEATQNGIEGGGRYLYAGSKATAEVALTMLVGKALGKLGLSTLEESITPGIRHSIREAFKNSGFAGVLKDIARAVAGVGGEVIEERAIDSTNQVIELVAGTREDYDWAQNDLAGLTAIAGGGAAKFAGQAVTEFNSLKAKIPDMAEGALAAEQALETVGVKIPRVAPEAPAAEVATMARDEALAQFTGAEIVSAGIAPESVQGLAEAIPSTAEILAQSETATVHPLVEATRAGQQAGPAGRGARSAKTFIENVSPALLEKALEPLDQKQFAALTGIKKTSEAFRESFRSTLGYYRDALSQRFPTTREESDAPLPAPPNEAAAAIQSNYVAPLREAATEFAADDGQRAAFMDAVIGLLKGTQGSLVLTEQDQQRILAAAKKFVDALTPDQRSQILAQAELPKETVTVARERMTRDQRKLQTAQRKYQEAREQGIALRAELRSAPREAVINRQEAIKETLDIIRAAIPDPARQARFVNRAVKARTPAQLARLMKSVNEAARRNARRAIVAQFQNTLRYAKNLRSEFADIV